MFDMKNSVTQSLLENIDKRVYKLNSDMYKKIRDILKENNNDIKSKNYNCVVDDDIVTTVFDENGVPFLFHIKGLRCIDRKISMVGILHYCMEQEHMSWDATSTEDYYRCLQFLKSEGK